MKLTATLALLLLATSASLVVAKPNRERRAPTSNIPATWGTKTILGHSVPFGQWERSTQCTHLENMQSAIELDWGSVNLPAGSSVTIDIVARPGNTKLFPRDTTSFYLWADGQALEPSKGSGTCPSDVDPFKCSMRDTVSHIASFPIPWGTKRFAILPASGKCQHTYYRLRAQIPGTCGNDEFRVPLNADGTVKRVLAQHAIAACSDVNGGPTVLAHISDRNLDKVKSVVFDCDGPNGGGLIHTWNGDDFQGKLAQVYVGRDKAHAASVKKPNGKLVVPICATVREETFGQESPSNLRVVTHNQGMNRTEAYNLCQDKKRGYGEIYSPWNDKFTAFKEGPDYEEALAMILAATGPEGAAWIQAPHLQEFEDACHALDIDEGKSFNGPSTEEPVIKGQDSKEDCGFTRLAAVVCVKSKEADVVRMLRSAE